MAQMKEKRMSVMNLLIILMSNMGMDTPANIEEITDFVLDDINETADPLNWHSGDVAIGFRRWIEAQANENEDEGTECTHGLHIPSYMVEPKSAEDVSIGETIYKVGELRYLMEGLDDQDQICVETCDENGDVQDLFPMSLDVIDGIKLTNGTEVREVRFCQRPNSAPDNRDKQPLVDALLSLIHDDMVYGGDSTVIDELLLRMPYDVLKHALPEDQWQDFE